MRNINFWKFEEKVDANSGMLTDNIGWKWNKL